MIQKNSLKQFLKWIKLYKSVWYAHAHVCLHVYECVVVGVHVYLHLCKRENDVLNVLKAAKGEEYEILLIFQIFWS